MPVHSNYFQRIPFIRILLLFLCGIFVRQWFLIDLRIAAVSITICLVILFWFWPTNSVSAIKTQNAVLSLALFVAGYFYPASRPTKEIPEIFSRKGYYLAEVCERPVEKQKSFQSLLLLKSPILSHAEKVIVYFSKADFDSTISTGDLLVLIAKPQPIENMGNPFEYDYQKMMARRGIRFTVYQEKGTYLKTGMKVSGFAYMAERFRDRLVAMLSNHIKGKEELAVVSALTLGYRAEIDKETIDYFASTGAMHVLSVSGLHVGIIFFILGFIFNSIKRRNALIFGILLLISLWSYAFISGFSPSVQRATVMFSFVVVADIIRRPVNVFNTITASALLLILLNPDVVFDVGFQLSYLAVLGIVLVQPALFNLLKVKNRILKWLWGFTTVSLAAQLITFPLGIYYFNQFPNLFWLSNFVVIPVTILITWFSLAFFVLSPIAFLATLSGQIIEILTFGMLWCLKYLDSLPFALAEGLVLNSMQVWLLYAGIASIIIFFSTKRTIWLTAFLILIVTFQISGLKQKHQLINQKTIIVYHSRNLMIHLINGRNSYIFTPDQRKLTDNEYRMIKRTATYLRLNSPRFIPIDNKSVLNTEDVRTGNGKLQFLNTLVDVQSNGFSRYATNDIQFQIFDRKGLPKEQVLISTGIKRPENVGIFRIFQTRTDGAFICNLSND